MQRGGGQALGGNWPSRTILIAWGADTGEPAHPIDVINDVDEEVIFHNLVFWKLELHLVSIDDVKCLLKMSDSIACCCCCKSLCLALTQLLNFIHSVHKIALFMSDNDTHLLLREKRNRHLTGLHTAIQDEAPWLKKVIVIICHVL